LDTSNSDIIFGVLKNQIMLNQLVFKIGELRAYKYRGDQFNVAELNLENKTNKRIIGLDEWHGFMLSAEGLYLMLRQELVKEVEPYTVLTLEHKAKIDAAYADINSLPEYHRETLEWLHFWVDWAIKNCKQPVIRNWYI
jgi:hypothetical protein